MGDVKRVSTPRSRGWRQIQEKIYDALDKIRFHPVIADYLNGDQVDSVKWYKDSGRILERLVAKLISVRQPNGILGSKKCPQRQTKLKRRP